MPTGQGSGRDHHINAFSIWPVGGAKGGMTWGHTDDLGFRYLEDGQEVHDQHATMLALWGTDHQRLTYRFPGRDFRLRKDSDLLRAKAMSPFREVDEGQPSRRGPYAGGRRLLVAPAGSAVAGRHGVGAGLWS